MINVRPDSGYDGMTRVGVGVASVDKAITITENGTYEVSDENNYINKVDITVKAMEPVVVRYWWPYIGGSYSVQKEVEVQRGQTYTLDEGSDLRTLQEYDYVTLNLTFVGWDSPIDIVDGKITIPVNYDEKYIDIYGNYTFAATGDNDGFFTNIGSATVTTGISTSGTPRRVFAKTKNMINTTSTTWKYSIVNLFLGSGINNSDDINVTNLRALVELVLPMSLGPEFGRTNAELPTYNSFNSCINLKKVHIPNNITILNNGIFRMCMCLTDVNIPPRLTTLGMSVFRNCRDLKNLTFPSTLTSIGNTCFNGCSKLQWLRFKSVTPPTIGTNVFPTTCKIYVPDSSINAYKEAWSSVAGQIYPESEFEM